MESFAMCEYLISKGADVNAQNSELKTPLHCAIEDDGFEIAKLLLKNGADPFLKSIHGDDALQTACICAVVGVFEYLIENYLYSKERTAEAHELIGSSLIEKRGNLGEALNHWKTALSIRNEDSNNYLEKKTIDRKAPFLDVTEFSSVEELEKISEDLDAIMMQTLLVRQRILERAEMKEIVYRVSRIAPRTSSGDTILHLVVSKERTIMNVSSRLDLDLDIFPHAGVAELLLQCGANVEAVNCSLNTPLHVAAEVHLPPAIMAIPEDW
ncbi:protein fem-1 homolog CG6966-like [Uloborus diversus]|uniref:protein fem-1 homolog CG6966-like n=1 Tax=Uloborus diversus TaxID=327109 RepID=UPI00240A33CE|nr:protein fem-1 homolog CG6966-like [Uloborus diversus]